MLVLFAIYFAIILLLLHQISLSLLRSIKLPNTSWFLVLRDRSLKRGWVKILFYPIGLTVQIFPAYTPPPDFNGGPNDYRAASSVTLTCQVSAGMIRGWSSTCTSNCFVQAQTTETITRTVLRSTDSGNHTCTATRDVKSATIEMNVVGE